MKKRPRVRCPIPRQSGTAVHFQGSVRQVSFLVTTDCQCSHKQMITLHGQLVNYQLAEKINLLVAFYNDVKQHSMNDKNVWKSEAELNSKDLTASDDRLDVSTFQCRNPCSILRVNRRKLALSTLKQIAEMCQPLVMLEYVLNDHNEESIFYRI